VRSPGITASIAASIMASITASIMASVALCGTPGVASARPHTADPAELDDRDFWRDLIEPHGAAVASILTRAKRALGRAEAVPPDADGAVDRRHHLLDDAYGMLRYARTLSPDNPEVLRLLGTTADELGKTRQALDALEHCARLDGPDRAGAEVTGRLGLIYLRLGKLDDAVRWLGYAQGPIIVGDHASHAVHLATALAARGQMPAAIDLLINALPAQINYFTEPLTAVSFALAVSYDRDDQPGAAFEVLDRMQTTLQQEMAPLALTTLTALPFAPAEDRYYYLAMLYEAIGDDIEARAEWALYAAVTDAPWRRRALDHIQAIDAQRRSRPAIHAAPAAPAGPHPVP
jgi:tetratricopeptide (TPR) repeat protein